MCFRLVFMSYESIRTVNEFNMLVSTGGVVHDTAHQLYFQLCNMEGFCAKSLCYSCPLVLSLF